MPAHVYHARRVYRTKFRLLPIGGDYYPVTAIASAPLIKADATDRHNGFTVGTGKLILTAVSPALAVARVNPVFLGQRTMR